MRFVMSPYRFGVRLMRRIRIVRDRRGVSAVEFALILPAIIRFVLVSPKPDMQSPCIAVCPRWPQPRPT